MSRIPDRTLGRSGIPVSPIGLGCWAIGGQFTMGETPVGWGQVDDTESIRAVQRGLDLGANFVDTADVYGTGHSERVLARALAGRRDKVVIATKFGNTFDEATRDLTGSSATPDYIRQACEASLKRLNTDYIDLYQLHLGDFSIEHAPEVCDTLDELVQAGKIRCYGWSTDTLERARVFAQRANCAAIQLSMNVVEDAAALIALCEQENLAAVIRGPLAMGLLTGKFKSDTKLPDDDVRGRHAPGWMKYFKEGKPAAAWLKKVEAIREILTSNGHSVAQGALAWLLTRSAKTLPIPGFKTAAQVEDNMGALDKGLLTAEQMHRIDDLLERHPVSVVAG